MKRKFRPMKRRCRATFAAGGTEESRIGGADAEAETLSDVQIVLEGEAVGHGVWLDREFCEAVAEAGNATGDVGLKVRYGHPSMCSDAIGTELGRARNFRVVDLVRRGADEKCAGVVADVEILKSAHSAPQGDIAAHVMATAKEDPSQFGMSIVFTYADWVVKDADGVRHSYAEEVGPDEEEEPDGTEPRARISEEEWLARSADGRVYAVLGRLHGADFTDTPAATDGIFSTMTLAEEAERMLDEHPEVFAAIERNPRSLVEFLARTGLDRKLESARVSGLQAVKDREIGELRAELRLVRGVLDARDAKIRDLESDAAGMAGELVAARERNEQLAADLDGARGELSDAKAALAAERARYREQVGLALRPPRGGGGGSGLELVRCTFAEEK